MEPDKRHILITIADERTGEFLAMHHVEIIPTGDNSHDATHAYGEAASLFGLADPSEDPRKGPQALIIYPSGQWETRRIADDHLAGVADIQACLAGYMEPIGLPGLVAYVNEDGQRLALPPNPGATALMLALGWRSRPGTVLLGTVMLFGVMRDNEVDVPDSVIAEWQHLRARARAGRNGGPRNGEAG